MTSSSSSNNSKQYKVMKLKTYEGYFSEFKFAIEGENEEEAEKALREWCDKYTNGYKLEKIYLIKEDQTSS